MRFIERPMAQYKNLYLLLMVWKDGVTIEPYTITISTEDPNSEVLKYDHISHRFGHLIYRQKERKTCYAHYFDYIN